MKSLPLVSYLLAQHPPWCWNTIFLQCGNTDHSSFSWYLSSHSFSVSCLACTCCISDSWSSILGSLSCVRAQSLQSCLTLCNPMDCRLPGFSVHGVFQVRKLEWVAISFSRRSSQPRDQTHISCVDRWILYPLSQLGSLAAFPGYWRNGLETSSWLHLPSAWFSLLWLYSCDGFSFSSFSTGYSVICHLVCGSFFNQGLQPKLK